jgi:P27 family predicted phage terminase small subunit
MPGPPPKPTALKKLAGNPGKRALNKSEPQPERVIPAMPRGLPKRAQRFWRDHAAKLEELGVLTAVDGPAFTLMALHYAVALEALEIIQRDVLLLTDETGAPEKIIRTGLMAVDENGAARKHPLLQVWRENSTAFRQYAAQFGLTPAARARLSIAEPSEEDDYEAFLRS